MVYTVVIKCTASTLEYDGKTTTTKCKKQQLHSQQTGPGIILESAPQNMTLCLFTETKWQMFRGIPGFYSTSGAVDYTAVIFCAHLVAVKCEVFTTTSTREIQLCARPATQLTRSPYFLQVAYSSPLLMREDLSQRQPIRDDYKGLQLLQSGRRGGRADRTGPFCIPNGDHSRVSADFDIFPCYWN